MKHIRFLAGLCSVTCGVTMTAPLSAVATGTIPTVIMEQCDFLDNSIEGLIVGEVAVTVADHPIHVTIVKNEPEGIFTYYDTDLSPQEDGSAIEYVFSVTYCEIIKEDDEIEYTADFLEYPYRSSYTITITALEMEDKGGIYTEENFLISNSRSETTVTGTTHYAYNVHFSESAEEVVTATEDEAVITDGSALLKRDVQFLWAPNILGDANEDGVVDIQDAYLILSYYACSAAAISPPSLNEKNADVDENETIDIMDASFTLNYYARCAVGENITFEDVIS